MTGFNGIIDPPTPFDPREVWANYLASLKTLESSPEVDDAIAQAEAHLAEPSANEDDEDTDDSDLDAEDPLADIDLGD